MMQKRDGIDDPRVRRTRKLLQKAMIEQAEEKGFAALTVRDITERAMVNRSTFYRHYLDKYDLLEQHLHEIYEALEKEGGILKVEQHEGLIELLKQFQQFPGFYRVALSTQGDAFVRQRLSQQMQQRFLTYFRRAFPEVAYATDPSPLDLKLTAIASAGCGALTWWLEQERPAQPEQFAHVLQEIIYNISISVLKLKDINLPRM